MQWIDVAARCIVVAFLRGVSNKFNCWNMTKETERESVSWLVNLEKKTDHVMAMPIWFEPNKLNMWTWRGRVGLFMSTWIRFPLTSTNSGITCCPKSRVCFPIPKTLELTFDSEIASKPYLIGTGSGLGSGRWCVSVDLIFSVSLRRRVCFMWNR